MWLLERTQGFSKILPSDLVFDPTSPIFKLIQDLIEISLRQTFGLSFMII